MFRLDLHSFTRSINNLCHEGRVLKALILSFSIVRLHTDGNWRKPLVTGLQWTCSSRTASIINNVLGLHAREKAHGSSRTFPRSPGFKQIPPAYHAFILHANARREFLSLYHRSSTHMQQQGVFNL